MKTIASYLFLFITGLIILAGCSKGTTNYVPISLTNKDGSIFIQIDTISKSFTAYSTTKITKGVLKGIFNDTIQSSFFLAITTPAYWDTAFHKSDTLIYPTHYTGRTIAVQTPIDFTHYSSPYHFLLLEFSGQNLKSGSHGKPSIVLTVDNSSN